MLCDCEALSGPPCPRDHGTITGPCLLKVNSRCSLLGSIHIFGTKASFFVYNEGEAQSHLDGPSCFFFNFLFYVGVELINNIVFVLDVQQNDSVIHIHVSILFQTLFPFRSLYNIEESSPCCIVGPCWLPILNTIMCACQSLTPNLSLSPHFSPGNRKFIL